MNAQELIDVIVMHYNAAPDDEVLSIGHNTKAPWDRFMSHFSPQISVTVGELRSMATDRARVAADKLNHMKQKPLTEQK
jgi:hypothetical protein